MPNVIVVGVDGNERAERAAETAARLAAATGAALHVVCAYSRDQAAEVEAAGEKVRISIGDESADIAARTAEKMSAIVEEVTSSAVQARPADALIDEAERLGATLIVVGNRRMQGIARVLGSVAAAVAHHAQCDVYIANTN
jgi:nucleotide-binding universal stress UspA family protein